MTTNETRIDALDVTLFDAIPSQTTEGERRSLLAIQRSTAHRHQVFSYLEIGSYFGGSLQPYVLDDRCRAIYSVDLRPRRQPDDRYPGCDTSYQDNSTERMLELLSNLGQGDTRKLVCFDADAADIDPKCIADAPQISFIDGEHTHRAVLSDYRFCASVMAGSGTIIFHDFDLVFPALYEICNMLKRRKSPCVPLKLDDNLGALFFEPQIIFTVSFAALSAKPPLYQTVPSCEEIADIFAAACDGAVMETLPTTR